MTDQQTAPEVVVTNVPGAQVAQIDTSAAATPSDPEAPLVAPETSGVPAMPEGGQEKYYNAEDGSYNWEAAFKEQAWIASQKGETEQAEPAENAEATPADVAEVAEINADDFNAQVMANEGIVPEEMLEQFKAKGIDPAIVQDYAATMHQKALDHIAQVETFLGGDTGLANLRDYMGKNFSSAEIEHFENQLIDPATWRAAAMTMLQAAGLPQGQQGIVKGPNAAPSATSGETFGSDAEFNQAMRDPRYKTDPAYRARVQNAVRNSPQLLGTGPTHSL